MFSWIYLEDFSMKPRNKYEKRVVEINATLKEDIAIKDFEWAKRNCIVDMGRADYAYFSICTNIKEFEVNRLYRIYKFTDKNTSHFFVVEIMREFVDGDRRTYFSKKRYGLGCSYFDTFSLNSDIELKSNERNYAGNMLSWLMDYSCGSRCQSSGRRMRCETRDCKELGRVICNNPVAETMYKENNPIFNYLMYRTHLKDVCRAYTLAKRHGFVFDNFSTPLWFDMVEAIIYCKKDFHNPVYIAPKDLLATHNRFIRMMHRKQEEAKLEREYKKIEKERLERKALDELYVKNRKRFFDMVLKSGDLEIRVLKSVDEFLQEAEFMHHCVYRCRYWDMKTHPHSLILSATIAGTKCETIEVNLDTYKVAQCYGKHDQFTNYHDKIVAFVKRHMKTIKAYNENKKQLKKAA